MLHSLRDQERQSHKNGLRLRAIIDDEFIALHSPSPRPHYGTRCAWLPSLRRLQDGGLQSIDCGRTAAAGARDNGIAALQFAGSGRGSGLVGPLRRRNVAGYVSNEDHRLGSSRRGAGAAGSLITGSGRLAVATMRGWWDVCRWSLSCRFVPISQLDSLPTRTKLGRVAGVLCAPTFRRRCAPIAGPSRRSLA